MKIYFDIHLTKRRRQVTPNRQHVSTFVRRVT